MKHSPLIVVECRRAKRMLLSAALVGAAGFSSFASDADAQQINPFVTQTRENSISIPGTSLGPVAQARLQMPQVHTEGHSSGPAAPANLASQSPSTTAISPTGPVAVGPDWSAFTPQSFHEEPLPAYATSSNTGMRPSRLPVADGNQFAGGMPPANPPNLATTRGTLASAARQRSQFVASTTPPPTSGTTVYLTSQTAQSQIDEAAKLLRQASLEYDCAAYASAETSAWDALEKAAQAIDLAASNSPAQNAFNAPQRISALEQLHEGRRAILEAQDFVGPFAHEDRQAIARLARAHQTDVVRKTLPPITARYSAEALARLDRSASDSNASTDLPTASEAIDRYLDFARTKLSGIAAQSLLAAQTMDLLAAIRLGRAESTQLPGPTAICLRRAAVQGQSDNADLVAKLGHHLADIGLLDEARWALGHSLTLQPNPANEARLTRLNTSAHRKASSSPYGSSILAATRPHVPQQEQPNRVPEITTMSPQMFAAISHSVIPGSPQSTKAAPQPSAMTPEVQYQAAAATTSNANAANGNTSNVATSSPTAPSPRSFFRAVTASFRSPTGHNEPSNSPPANELISPPSSQSYAPQTYDSTSQYGNANPYGGTHSTQATPASYATPPEPDQREGRVSSRLLPGLKKWW
ncbi:hypothetical protein [Aporhodopirellula aestuarii]|uniref:Transmembrane protein n=1 Tax=Aporhodopirellula aestuarii TaxID=2950107 RepID=A0ABT0U3A4_9BACT|nr:hypothetical protein [Aporhodopirellula aestuarii]MCM2371384.1 hypothetical protein [Aporhodopirellula aestuarii]